MNETYEISNINENKLCMIWPLNSLSLSFHWIIKFSRFLHPKSPSRELSRIGKVNWQILNFFRVFNCTTSWISGECFEIWKWIKHDNQSRARTVLNWVSSKQHTKSEKKIIMKLTIVLGLVVFALVCVSAAPAGNFKLKHC